VETAFAVFMVFGEARSTLARTGIGPASLVVRTYPYAGPLALGVVPVGGAPMNTPMWGKMWGKIPIPIFPECRSSATRSVPH